MRHALLLGLVLFVKATINACAHGCQSPVDAVPQTWGRMKSLYR